MIQYLDSSDLDEIDLLYFEFEHETDELPAGVL